MDPSTIDALLRAALKCPMSSKDEIAAQRKSWVIGEMMLARPDMTREEAERIYSEVSE
jgi:hypothetical protein